MVIDKFGRSLSSSRKRQNSQFYSLILTDTGDLDVEHKRVCNLRKPSNPDDAVNKFYVDDKVLQITNPIKNEMRQKILQLSTTLRKVENQFGEIDRKLSSDVLNLKSHFDQLDKKLSDEVLKLKTQFDQLDEKLSKEVLEKTVIIASPQLQNPKSTLGERQFSSATPSSTASVSETSLKQMKIN